MMFGIGVLSIKSNQINNDLKKEISKTHYQMLYLKKSLGLIETFREK